jgi:hypothetical protein
VKGVESGSFSSPTNRFVAVRNELAARAKAAGHENIAIRLRSMKQPPMVFRLADKLGREVPKMIQSLLHPASSFATPTTSRTRRTVDDAHTTPARLRSREAGTVKRNELGDKDNHPPELTHR